jgi:hypothetical protein
MRWNGKSLRRGASKHLINLERKLMALMEALLIRDEVVIHHEQIETRDIGVVVCF